MQKKQGISLIVLVITIIVMIILAATVVISLTSNSVIDRANQAVQLTDEKQVQDLAAITWAETYMNGIKDQFILETKVSDKKKYKNEVASNGIAVSENEYELNEYGFYYDIAYKKYDFEDSFGNIVDTHVIFRADGTVEIYDIITSETYEEGQSLGMCDFTATEYVTAYDLKFNTIYSGTGALGMQCCAFVDEKGVYRDKFVIPAELVVYSDKKVTVADGAIEVEFYNDGKTFYFDGEMSVEI